MIAVESDEAEVRIEVVSEELLVLEDPPLRRVDADAASRTRSLSPDRWRW